MSNEVIQPDQIAFQDDIAHIAEVLEDAPDQHALDYVAHFLTGIARSASDARLEKAAGELARKCASGEPAPSETAVVAGMLQRRLSEKVAI